MVFVSTVGLLRSLAGLPPISPRPRTSVEFATVAAVAFNLVVDLALP
jgi:hypothetical protein